MIINRRDVLLAAMASLLGPVATAQADKAPIKVLVGFPPGGATDAIARTVLERAGQLLGQPIIIDNKPGLGGRLAADALLAAPADGLSFMVAPNATPTFQMLVFGQQIKWHILRDFAPVAGLASYPLGIGVALNTGASNAREFIAWAKANPAKANFGTPGLGGQNAFLGVQLAKTVGTELPVTPYKGSPPMVTDLVGGHIPRRLSGFGSGPRRGELPCQARRQRGVWRGHTTSWQRRLARQITSALRVGPAKGLIRRCKASLCHPAQLRFAPRLSPFAGPTRARPKARQPPCAISLMDGMMAQHRAGRIKVIGLFTKERSPLMPDIPTFAEQGINVTSGEGWTGMWAKAGTPPAALERMQRAVQQALQQPDISETLAQKLWAHPHFRSGTELDALQRAELAHWEPIIKASGFKPE